METQALLHIIYALVAFILFLTLQSWFINGISTSAAGTTEKYPDGTDNDSEMILYPLKKWLTQSFTKKIYYSGDEFKKLWGDIRKKYYNSLPSTESNGFNVWVFNADDKDQMMQVLKKVEEEKGVKSEWNGRHVQFYKEIRFAKYSKYVRKPIIECIKCMSSFWGTLTYWPTVLMALDFGWWMFGVWIADIVILSYVNWYWHKKTD